MNKAKRRRNRRHARDLRWLDRIARGEPGIITPSGRHRARKLYGDPPRKDNPKLGTAFRPQAGKQSAFAVRYAAAVRASTRAKGGDHGQG
jgi:antitoxin (DNA-binding transcriptional repressor) of toxin-antitoxin stability system